MLTKLPSKITTIEEAKTFLTELHKNGEEFHPDDDAHTIVWDGVKTPPTKKECDRLNDLMTNISDLAGFDPSEFLLLLDSPILKKAIFTLPNSEGDGNIEIAGYYDPTDSWNGFAKPFLTIEELEKLRPQVNGELDADVPFVTVKTEDGQLHLGEIEGGLCFEVLQDDEIVLRLDDDSEVTLEEFAAVHDDESEIQLVRFRKVGDTLAFGQGTVTRIK